MGQDAIDHAADVAGLTKGLSRTLDLHLHGWTENSSAIAAESDRVYGSDLPLLEKLSNDDPTLDAWLHPRLPYRLREVVWAARYEMARTVEDILARRTRALFLDAQAAIEAAPIVAGLLARELNRNDMWKETDLQAFVEVAKGYLYKED
jgi:glycerol-3-phosphate dehydrogenase